MVAKGLIVSGTIVIIVLAAIFVGIYMARRQERIQARQHGHPLRGDLNRHEEEALLTELAEAARILRNLGRNDVGNFEDPEILRADTKIDVGRWLKRYDSKRKVSQ